ncbi:MAG TPA: hypothetical protein PLW11_00275 [Bacillota bacterium]|nr:hypothetical protein [Bacillota bacterium]
MKGYYKNILYMILVIACVICVAAGLASCASKANNPAANKPIPQTNPAPENTASQAPAPDEESLIGFYPMKAGNVWEYEGEGMEYASYVQEVLFDSGNKHQLAIDNGGTDTANVIEERKDSIVNTYRSEEAYDKINILGEPGNINIILLQTPLEKGNFWISEENHYEIADTEADVTVPAGEFKGCIAVKVTFKDQTSNMMYYYKKGIGMVQSEFRTDTGDLIASKLKRYMLK